MIVCYERKEVKQVILEWKNEFLGKTTINNKEYLWNKGDIFVVPPWAKIKHDTKEESVLFSFSDRPVQELLGLFREKIYN